MSTLPRHCDETILIGSKIRLTASLVDGKRAVLSIQAPLDCPVYRLGSAEPAIAKPVSTATLPSTGVPLRPPEA